MKRNSRMAAVIISAAAVMSLSAMVTFAEETQPLESVTIGATKMVSSLVPTDSTVPWWLTSCGVSETVYKLDEQGNLVSRFIDSMAQEDDTTWTVEMKEGPEFSDGTPVDAESMCACLNQISEENASAFSTAGASTFEVTGDYSFTIKTENVTRVMPSILGGWGSVVFKNNGDDTYCYTGPYMVDELDPGVSMKVVPNEYYDDQASQRPETVEIKCFKDMSAMQLAFESGEIDMAFQITGDVASLLSGEGYTVKDIDAGYQYYAYLNMNRLDDMNVRKALDLATDRQEMLDTLGCGRLATGIFATYYSFAGTTQLEYNLEEAQSLLEESGWSKNADGLYEKDGNVLTFKLVTYNTRPDLPILMQVMASQLTKLGAEVTAEVTDNIGDAAKTGEYDIILYSTHTAPAGDPANFLQNTFTSEGSGNYYTNYKSEEFDKVVAELVDTPIGEKRDELAIEAQDILHQDLPVLYLIDPQWHIAVSDKLANYETYCGDYYMVTPQLGLN